MADTPASTTSSLQSALRRYSAFISYCHQRTDRRWAKWLHSALETYRIPARLRRERGLPRRLRPTFRDEEELSAGQDLSSSLQAALEQSDHLIVVCSPHTPQSTWVEKEIEYFQRLGREEHILALLVDGNPASAFPKRLRERRRAAVGVGEQSSEHVELIEPLAADVRPSSTDSQRHVLSSARLRLLSAVLGVSFDDLRQREQERQMRRVLSGAAVLCAFAIAMTGLALYANAQRGLAVERRREADAHRLVAEERRKEADEQRQQVTVQRDHAQRAQKTAEAQRDRAEKSFQFARKQTDTLFGVIGSVNRDSMTIGNLGKLWKMEQELREIVDEFYAEIASAEDQNDPVIYKSLAQALGQLASLKYELSSIDGSASTFAEAVSAIEKASALAPNDVELLDLLADLTNQFGIALIEQGDRRGEEVMRKSLATRAKLKLTSPNDYAEFDVSTGHLNLSLAYMNRREFDAAEAELLKAVSIRRRCLDAAAKDDDLMAAWYSVELGIAELDLAAAYRAQSRLHDSTDLLTALVGRLKAIPSDNVPEYLEEEHRQTLGGALNGLTLVYSHLRDNTKAVEFAQEALAVIEKLDPRVVHNRIELARCRRNLVMIYVSDAKNEEAADAWKSAMAAYRELYDDNQNVVGVASDVISMNQLMLLMTAQTGDYAKAREYADATVDMFKELDVHSDGYPTIRQAFRGTYTMRARILLDVGDFESAERDLAAEFSDLLGPDLKRFWGYYRLIGEAARGDYVGAVLSGQQEAANLAKSDGTTGKIAFDELAEIFAVAAGRALIDEKLKPTDRVKRAERYSSEVIDVLSASHGDDTPGVDLVRRMRSGATFSAVRERDDFKALLARFEAAAAPPPKK